MPKGNSGHVRTSRFGASRVNWKCSLTCADAHLAPRDSQMGMEQLTKDSRADLDKWKHISQREGLFHILWKIKFMFETTSQKCISAYLNYARLICSESPLLTISTPVNWVQSDKPSCACLHMFVRRLSPVQNIHHNVINHGIPYTHYIYIYILYCKQQFAEDFAQPMVMFIDYWLYHITGSVLSL